MLALFAISGPANAGEPALKLPPDAFKDLPGVTTPDINAAPKYQCSIVTRYTESRGDVHFLAKGMPYLVYHCERDGMVYESTEPPLSWEWAPGINPQTLPK